MRRPPIETPAETPHRAPDERRKEMTRKSIFVVVMLLCIAASSFWFWQSRASSAGAPTARESPVPAAKVQTTTSSQAVAATPPGKVSADPKPRSAAAGFDTKSLVACRSLSQRATEAIVCDEITDPQQHSQCLGAQGPYAQALERLSAEATACPARGFDAADYYEALRERALSGEVDAQRCFITGDFFNPMDKSTITDEQRAQFPALANRFIDAAIARGDWRVVRYLGRVKTGLGDGLLAAAYPIGGDAPETVYKMHVLLLLGLGPNAEDFNQFKVQETVDIFKSGQYPDFTAAQRQRAEEWARDTYQAHFAGVPDNPKSPEDTNCM
jgi:hypothetical protein